MKKQLANYFDIIPRDDVNSIDAGVLTLAAGKSLDRILTKNNLIVLDKPKQLSGNPYYEQSSKMVCAKLSSELRSRYRNNRTVIVRLYYSDNTTLIWGELTIPVRVSISPELNHDVLEMFRKSRESLL